MTIPVWALPGMRLRGLRDAAPRTFKDRGAIRAQPHGFETDLLRAPHSVGQFRRKTLLPFEPVFAKQFNGMLCADVAVSAVHRISGTVFIASPAISFGMLRVDREFLCHLIGPPRGWKTRRAAAGFAPSLIFCLRRPAGRRLRQLASGFAPLAPICRT